MMLMDKRDVYEEYDPPLPKRIAVPTQENEESLRELIEKYEKLADERKRKSNN